MSLPINEVGVVLFVAKNDHLWHWKVSGSKEQHRAEHSYVLDSVILTLPPLRASQFVKLLEPQNEVEANEVSFCRIEGHILWFWAGVPTPIKLPYR